MSYKKILIPLFLLFSISIMAQDLVQWRGINRDGIYNETGLLTKWPKQGLKMLWHYDELGKGFSSPLVLKDKIIITGLEDTSGVMYALDLEGRLIWKTVYANEWDESFPGCRSTPTFLNNRVYVSSSYGQAVCLDVTNGNIVWSVDLAKDFGAEPPKWGIVESPVVVDDKVIFGTGGKDFSVVALNIHDGKTIWTSPGRDQLTAYCSPIVINHNGRRIFCTFTSGDILGIELETGKVLWNFPYKNRYSVHANTPLYADGQLFIVSGYGYGGIKLKIAADGNSVTEVWKNEFLDNQMGGVVLLNNTIYGSGQQKKEWMALDWETGAVKYRTKNLGKGITIANDDMLYCYSDNGKLALVKPTDKKFKIISKMEVTTGNGEHWSHPVIQNKILYLRHGNALIAYSLAAE
jgi:outer membrane protein assembly factor BamB